MSAASGLLHPNPARTWYATDALGSVRLTTSDTGAALSSIDDDPWGAVERGTPARFGFTGELQQGSTVHLRARWYNTASGSFASVDPYAGDPASPASLAPSMYAYNQPTGFTDPSGRCAGFLAPVCSAGAAAGSISIATAGLGALVVIGATWEVNHFILSADAAQHREDLKRGFDYVVHGGQGYTLTGNPFSLDGLPGLPNTAHPQPPIQYEPPTGPTQRNPSMEDIVSGFPLPGPSCPDQEGFSLNGPFDWSSFRTPPMDPGEQVHGPQVLNVSTKKALENVLSQFPTEKRQCVDCAEKVAQILRNAGEQVNIVSIQNRVVNDGAGGLFRPEGMYARDAHNQGKWVQVANTGYHEAVQIATSSGYLYLDSLVYEHFGLKPIDWETYISLWVYPEDVEITGSR